MINTPIRPNQNFNYNQTGQTPKKKDLYLEISKNKLSNLETLSLPENGSFNLKDFIDQRFQDINTILIDSTKEAGCIPKKTLKPKAYLCPELSALRDKKRIWWTIWVSCDRPRNGLIYNILKDLKKKFRRLCRQKIRTVSNKPLDILNSCFKNRDMCAFWNKLKSNNRMKVNSKLSSNNIADFYKSTMTDDNDLRRTTKTIHRYKKQGQQA